MKENIKIGIIGLGQRGGIMLENPIIPMMKNGAGIEIAAVCDLLPDRVTAAAEKLEKAGFTRLRLTPRQKLEPGYWASADGKAALAEIEAMLAANPRCIIETNDAGGNQLTADYAAARGIDLDGLRVGISGSVGQMFGALFGSEHLGTLLLTGGDTLLQCMNSVGARELEPVCELESGIVLARFAYQGRTRYVITKSGGFGQEDLLVELADRIAKH